MNKHVFQFDLMIQHLHHIKFVECTKKNKKYLFKFQILLKNYYTFVLLMQVVA